MGEVTLADRLRDLAPHLTRGARELVHDAATALDGAHALADCSKPRMSPEEAAAIAAAEAHRDGALSFHDLPALRARVQVESGARRVGVVAMSQLLVDGSWLTCSTWWADPNETPARFAATIRRVADLCGAVGTPRVAWDAPGGSWRSEIQPRYKSHRSAKPEALVHALAACRRLPELVHAEAPGYEADDLLATLAAASDDQIVILTTDKDLMQLVSDRVRLVNRQGEFCDAAEVERRWGVPPDCMRLLLSWMGDTSDGLPGVPKVGPKRAIPYALAGAMGDPLTWELVGLATVPREVVELWWTHEGQRKTRKWGQPREVSPSA